MTEEASVNINLPENKKIKKITPFLKKLRSILDNPNLNTIINWEEHGNYFEILDVNKFEMIVLPIYYKSPRLETFFRQLNIYSFKRLNYKKYYNGKSQRVMAFRNECFKRESPELTSLICRKENKRLDGATHECENKTSSMNLPDNNLMSLDNDWAWNLDMNNYFIPDLSYCIPQQTYIDNNYMVPNYEQMYIPNSLSPGSYPNYYQQDFNIEVINSSCTAPYYPIFTSDSLSSNYSTPCYLVSTLDPTLPIGTAPSFGFDYTHM